MTVSDHSAIPLLVARGITKRFSAVEALVDADCDIDAGDYWIDGKPVICHNLDSVSYLADRISVLRLGRHVGTYDRRSTAREEIVAAITGASPGRAVAA